MPFRSKEQMRKFAAMVRSGQITKATFDRWLAETPNPHLLPERVPQLPRRRRHAKDRPTPTR